jgi:hypothetical protein
MGNKMLVGWSKSAKMAFGLFIVLLVISYIFYARRFYQKGEVEFKDFYRSDIIGTISCKTYAGSSGTYFCVDDERYNFHPYTSDLNNNKIFDYLAEEGDSIYKPAYSDTLVLIKEGKRYQYTFSKIE